jgi:phosphate transport system protein
MLDFARHEMDGIHKSLLNMAQMSLDAVDRALHSAYERDTVEASEVIESDHIINEMMRELDRKVMRVMALEQPVARDLRFLFGTMRMVTDLERIGDEAYIIAERALILSEKPTVDTPALLRELGDVTQKNMLHTLKMLATLDSAMAWNMCDNIMPPVDLSRKLIREMTELTARECHKVEGAIQFISMATMLRRICEHCMNVAENVIFITEGEDVRGLYQDRIKC